MRRAYQVDRELLLLAYEHVTPPVTPKQDELRAKLLACARAIIDSRQPVTAPAGPGVARSRGRQMLIPGAE